MKLTRFACLLIAAFVLVAFSAIAQTNEVAFFSTGASPGNPFIGLLTGKFGWLATVSTWLTAIRVGVIPIFSVQIRHFMFDKMNEIAASDDKDDDAYLTELFSAKWYKLTAFALRFIGVALPVMADLQRALDLQKKAVENASK